MPDKLTVDDLHSKLRLEGVTVIRLEVEAVTASSADDSEESDEHDDDGEQLPIAGVLPNDNQLSVAASYELVKDDVAASALLFADYRSADSQLTIDKDRDEEALTEFGRQIVDSVLRPRMEAVVACGISLIGPMTRVPALPPDAPFFVGMPDGSDDIGE
ncbi:hypothetical protein CLV30_13146 [Haloactinopolyspora alba]|uniref:Uncharacterized protein n=1 Tax=Haloactinopolyspora alba TaxID=648780 RepID=A0A2P8D753_9ACTN|nr:hypothetical protein [Haloactinopolyspora alba]PSK93019.1 hypothetical protein CLV30_13146 [Haloactinopolyspora alba]